MCVYNNEANVIMDACFLRTALLVFALHAAPALGEFNTGLSLTARCGQNLKLYCRPPQDTPVTMTWAHRESLRYLCGGNTSLSTEREASYRCSLGEGGYLELTLLAFQPRDQGTYICKLNSAVGAFDQMTSVSLDANHSECYSDPTVTVTNEELSCTFTGVFPEGEVHWFQGSTRLQGNTTESVEARGSFTISSTLTRSSESGHTPYNCSLWSTWSRRYLTSHLILAPERQSKSQTGNGADTPRALWVTWFMLLVKHVLMKLWD